MYCRNCNKPYETHINGKCLFESTRYAPPVPGDSVERLLHFFATNDMTPEDVKVKAVQLIAAVHPNGLPGAQTMVMRDEKNFNLTLKKGDSVDIRLKWVIG